MDLQKSPSRWFFADMAQTVPFRKWPRLTILRGLSPFPVLCKFAYFYKHQILAFSTKKASETSLTLLDTLAENVAEANLEPMKIKVFHFDE